MTNVTSLKTFFVTSAIMNIISFLGWSISALAGGMITCGLGCLFGILPLFAALSCAMDFVAYTKLNSQNRSGTFATIKFAAMLDIATIVNGNVISMVLGILSLNQLNNRELKNYLYQKGIY